MKNLILIFLLSFTITSSYGVSKIENNESEDTILIKIYTTQGEIELKLFDDKAPETTKNFIQYAEAGKYNGTIFHRVIKDFMIQGGGHLPDLSEIATESPVVNESNNGLSNKKGTIAMARTSDPHSATSQFFINLKDNDFLDKKNAPDNYGYCVFGEVTNGIDIVEKIGESQTGRNGMYDDVPMETVLIEKVEIIKE
jgi:peptidyl-prolyl cis-trans isomerase B (cyclophilin B)|tara:strand:- start:662 stop:1252 length:591 start_codon:yes stop_codon:yes gene_type:complete